MFEKTYKENLFIMKLLASHPKFLEDVKKIRKKIKIPVHGFDNEILKKHWLGKNLNALPPNKRSLLDESGLFYNAESLTKKYQLRYNFLIHIKNFIISNKIDAPKINFAVSLGPDPSGNRSNKWVSIKAYASLTKEEIRAATKKLLQLQKEFLPSKVTLDLRPKIDIDLAIKIEEEMRKRKKEWVEHPSMYLSILKKQYSETEYEKIKKKNGYKVDKKLEQYTSKEIAKKFFKKTSKASLVRKIYSVIQKKRKMLFGD